MQDVLASFDAALSDRLTAEDTQALAVRRRWREVLVALRDGPRMQRELVEQVGLDKAQVSRVLAELRDAQLVSELRTEHQDARVRPHVLTPAGAVLAEKLGTQTRAFNGRETALLKFAPALFATLMAEGELSAEFAVQLARGDLEAAGIEPAAAVETLRAESERLGLLGASRVPGTPPFSSSFSLVRQWIAAGLALDGRPPGWDALQRAAPSATMAYWVRCSAENASAWEQFLIRGEAPGLPLRAGSRVLRARDLLDALVDPPEVPFALIYEGVALWKQDRLHAPALRALEKKARARVWLEAEGQPLPREGGYRAVTVHAVGPLPAA